MRIVLFEDRNAIDFRPLTWLRPVFELVCGHFSLRERVIRQLCVTEWGALLREHLAETYREQHPEARVNDVAWLSEAPTLLINGRWLPDATTLAAIKPDEAGVIDGTLVYLTLDPLEVALLADGPWDDALCDIARSRARVAAGGQLLSRPWDLIEQNPQQLALDFAARKFDHRVDHMPREHVAVAGPVESIFIDRTARIDPFVVIDARQGPVSIEAGAIVQSFTRLEGPCHVGSKSQLFRANVRGGTTIGPQCRVGGEIEAAILHGFANKYHDGFLGHSYVCPWVNLGAMTTNSDLKNDYSNVTVPLNGESIDTGLTKVGCFIGDFTKTGLGTLFNTGSSIGVMCMILPAGELLPKYLPSFAGLWHGAIAPGLPLERNLIAARVALERRNCEFTAAQERLLRWLFQQTQPDRDVAIARSQAKRAAKTVAPSS